MYGAGYKPWELARLMWRDVVLVLEAQDEKHNHDFEVARSIVYTIHCHNTESKNRKSIYELWPLPSDPTAEERAEMEAEKLREEEAKMFAMMELYKQHGYMN